MVYKKTSLFERLLTQVTLERPLFSVYAEMLQQHTAVREGFLADAALMPFLQLVDTTLLL